MPVDKKNKPASTGQGKRRAYYNKDYLRDAIAWGVVAVLNLIQIIVFVVYFALQRG